MSSNPERARPAGLAHARFRLLPVRSPLLREYFLFLGVHEMFQFPRCPPHQDAVTSASWLGCPIRRSWDQSLLTAPPRLSQLCHVLHRHAAPRHPPSAHSVFPEGRRDLDDVMILGRRTADCRNGGLLTKKHFALHLVRYKRKDEARTMKEELGALQRLIQPSAFHLQPSRRGLHP